MRLVHDDRRALRGLDLNLLLVLEAALRTRHVTRAARELGLSQSAASHALARLRAALGDELLVRTPRGMVRTARAEALADPLAEALAALGRALAGPEPFDPARATRTFRLGCADYAQLVLLPPLMRRLATEAPGVSLFVMPAAQAEATHAALAAGELDLSLGPTIPGAPTGGVHRRHLLDETFVCVVRGGHPVLAEGLTLERFLDLDHGFIAPRGAPGGAVDRELAARGRSRRVALTVPHFLVMPHVVASTDLVATVARRVAELVAGPLGLCLLEPPLPIPGFQLGVEWHERAHRDPAHAWLRRCLAEVAGALAPAPRSPARRARGRSA
jgi:DNA-binding transcriptional LysR family regulator